MIQLKTSKSDNIVNSIKASSGAFINDALLLYGAAGTGKTRTIGELFLRDDNYILLFHFGRGAPGIRSIESYLLRRLKNNKDEVTALLEKRLAFAWINTTEALVHLAEAKWEAVKAYLADKPEFVDKITHLVFEEFNSAQGRYEYNITPKKDGIPRITLTRKSDGESGGSMGHFGDLKIGTEWIIESLFKIQPPDLDRRVFQIWTTHEGITKIHTEQGETGPALQGKALTTFLGAFSYIIQCILLRTGFGKAVSYDYIYRLRSNAAISKIRGEGWPQEIRAIPPLLWDIIEQKILPQDIPADFILVKDEAASTEAAYLANVSLLSKMKKQL